MGNKTQELKDVVISNTSQRIIIMDRALSAIRKRGKIKWISEFTGKDFSKCTWDAIGGSNILGKHFLSWSHTPSSICSFILILSIGHLDVVEEMDRYGYHDEITRMWSKDRKWRALEEEGDWRCCLVLCCVCRWLYYTLAFSYIPLSLLPICQEKNSSVPPQVSHYVNFWSCEPK